MLPGGLNWPLDLAVGDDGRSTSPTAPTSTPSPRRRAADRRDAVLAGLSGLPARAVAAAGAGRVRGHHLRRPGRPLPAGDGETDYLADGFDQLYGVAVGPRRRDRVRRTRHRPGARACGRASSRRWRPGCAIRSASRSTPDGAPLVAESGAGRVVRLTGSGAETVVDGLHCPQGILVRDGRLYIVDAGAKEVIAVRPGHQRRAHHRRRVCRSAAARASMPKPLKGMPPFSGPQGPFAGIAAGPDGTLYVSADGDGSVLALRRDDHDDTPADHRYLQVARTLRKEIVDGVFPVGSQLPTEHELCERFAVSRYTVREALRRLRDDNLVASRPGAGTLVVPRPSDELLCAGRHVDQRPARFRHRRPIRDRDPTRWSSSTTTLADAHRADSRDEWLAVTRLSAGRRRRRPGLPDRVLHQPGFAAVGRLLQRHTGPIFPLIEDLFGVSVVEVHQEISAVVLSRRAGRRGSRSETGTRCTGNAAHATRHRTVRSHRSRVNTHPSSRLPPLDDHAPGHGTSDQ